MNNQEAIRYIIHTLKNSQTGRGSWEYPFEIGITTDAYMIILLRTLEYEEEDLVKALADRILSRQETNGAWKLYKDEDNGNISATIDAYYALLYSGYYTKNDPRLLAAKKFILSQGGISKANMFTKLTLTLTGQHDWPRFFPLPVELILLPSFFPVSLFSFSVYGRANLIPIMIAANYKYSLKTKKSPNLSDLFINRDEPFFPWFRSKEWKSLYKIIKQSIKYLIGLPSYLHASAIQQAKQYMLDRIEKDGTFYSYFSSTFFMIFALLALGHPKKDRIIQQAVNGLISMKTEVNGQTHMQYTTASIWNTALISYSLQEAGIPASNDMIQKANAYLQRRQHDKYGDWAVHNPGIAPGGWGFSNINTINPDVDDSTAALRALAASKQEQHNSWRKGIRWVLSMQNHDGGWPAFEKNTDSKLISLLPIYKGEFLLTDPSSADLTGRALQFLGDYTNMTNKHQEVKSGVMWLIHHQEKDGSWYGRWGICYIYGTWATITGLISVKIAPHHPTVKKGVKWLKEIQNEDGGWGESCKSDLNSKYTPLGTSTLVHTAWALDALIAAADTPSKEIKKGMEYLTANIKKHDWTTEYPAGQGMAGELYIHYHSYRYIFPLLAIAHYEKKWGELRQIQ